MLRVMAKVDDQRSFNHISMSQQLYDRDIISVDLAIGVSRSSRKGSYGVVERCFSSRTACMRCALGRDAACDVALG